MIPLDFTVLDTCLVLRDSSDEEQTIITREPFGRGERVWKQDEEQASPKSAEGTDDNEFVSP